MPAEPTQDPPDRPPRSDRRRPCSGSAAAAWRLSIAIAALLTAATVAAAITVAGEGERAALEYEATRLVALPYWAFERAAGRRDGPFDWSTDGCSRTPEVLAARFAGPCRQHDFAYRNLGRGLGLRDTEGAREWADARLLDELRRRCAELFAGWRLARCRMSARAMWAAVRRLGPRWKPSRAATRVGGCRAARST